MDFVCIDLGKDRLGEVLFGVFFENGGHLTAGTATVGIEVDNDWEAGFGGVFLEKTVEFMVRTNVSYQWTSIATFQ